MERVVDGDVVPYPAMKAFAQLQTSMEQEIVVDLVVAGTIVEIHVPTMVAAPAVIAQDDWFDRVQQRQPGQLGTGCFLQAPVPVPAPGVKAPVVARFLHRVENIAEFNYMPAPAAVAEIDAGAGHVVNRTVARGDVLGHRDLNRGRLLFY